MAVVCDLETHFTLRRERVSARKRHLRASLRQAHGDLRGPVPPERLLVMAPPLVSYLTEFFN